MKYILPIIASIILFSCGEGETRNQSQSESALSELRTDQLRDTTIQFLWRGMTYDSSLSDSVSSIFINHNYVRSMTEPEKAAIGYVATPTLAQVFSEASLVPP